MEASADLVAELALCAKLLAVDCRNCEWADVVDDFQFTAGTIDVV